MPAVSPGDVFGSEYSFMHGRSATTGLGISSNDDGASPEWMKGSSLLAERS